MRSKVVGRARSVICDKCCSSVPRDTGSECWLFACNPSISPPIPCNTAAGSTVGSQYADSDAHQAADPAVGWAWM